MELPVPSTKIRFGRQVYEIAVCVSLRKTLINPVGVFFSLHKTTHIGK